MTSAYSYDQEHNMETTKLMQTQSETNTLDTKADTKSLKGENDANQGESCDLTNKENVDLSASSQSVKCCNGFLAKTKFKKQKVAKGPELNGNGKCYFASFKEKFGNGKHHVEKKCDDPESLKKSVIFEDRDPFKINSHIKLEFAHVFAEPNTGTYSFNPVWSFTNRMYFSIKLFFYRLFSILIGIPFAFVFSIIFALLSVLQIWCLNPVLRLFKAFFGIIRDIWCMIIDTVFGPIVQLFYTHRQYQSSTSSNCTSTVSSKSIYNEDGNIV